MNQKVILNTIPTNNETSQCVIALKSSASQKQKMQVLLLALLNNDKAPRNVTSLGFPMIGLRSDQRTQGIECFNLINGVPS